MKCEKSEKYQGLKEKLKKTVKAKVIPVISGTFRIVVPKLKKFLQQILETMGTTKMFSISLASGRGSEVEGDHDHPQEVRKK